MAAKAHEDLLDLQASQENQDRVGSRVLLVLLDPLDDLVHQDNLESQVQLVPQDQLVTEEREETEDRLGDLESLDPGVQLAPLVQQDQPVNQENKDAVDHQVMIPLLNKPNSVCFKTYLYLL